MVEFGLKLADNRVEDWAHAYINYEVLKSLIDAARKAVRTREELEERDVSLAAKVRDQLANDHNNNDEHSSAAKVMFSDLSLYNDEYSETQSLMSYADSRPFYVQDMHSAESSLHGGASASSSYPQKSRMKRSGSEISLSSMGVMVDKFTGYFQKNSFEKKLKKSIKNEMDAIQNFHAYLYDEAAKVNELYFRILDEMNERLEYLEETVNNSKHFQEKKNNIHNWHDDMRFKVQEVIIPTTPITQTTKLNHVDSTGTDTDHGLESDGDEIENKSTKVEQYQAIRESDSVQRAMTDLHRKSKLLLNFAIMNSTGFIKIIKKFDKKIPSFKGRFKDVLKDGFICEDGKQITKLSEKMEILFAKWFCDGNKVEARSLLLPKKGDGLDMDWSQLRLGYRLGMCSVLALWVAWDCVWGLVKDGNSTIGGRTAFPVFRACGGLLLVHWFWGVSVYVWNRFRINYIFLFDFDPRIVQTPVMIFEDATDETLVFLLLMLLYYKSGAHAIPDIIPPGGYPFLLVMFTLYRLIFPLKVRVPLWHAIFQVISAPITKPTFFHTYVADIFTSMVKVFQDILWTGCFFVSGDFLRTERDGIADAEPNRWHECVWYKKIVVPLICLVPLWIRFNQCLRRYIDTGKRNPNLFNAAKYALSQCVTLFGAFHPLYLNYVEKTAQATQDDTIIEIAETGSGLFSHFWMVIFMTSSLYSYFWDVRMDWGLGRLDNRLLGTRLMFPKVQVYYLVMSVDLFLRFLWVTTLIPPQSGALFEIPQYLSLVTMSLELFRRTIWGFFRLEHEHRHNSQGFRRVDFVPLHFSTESPNKLTKIEHDGWQVLGEVIAVTIVVVTISAWSVIEAQKETNGMAMPHADL